jgi:hypothetical protein
LPRIYSVLTFFPSFPLWPQLVHCLLHKLFPIQTFAQTAGPLWYYPRNHQCLLYTTSVTNNFVLLLQLTFITACTYYCIAIFLALGSLKSSMDLLIYVSPVPSTTAQWMFVE